MRDNLQDLIQYTHGLGIIDLVKVAGTDQETQISAIADDKSVVVNGVTKAPVTDFVGTFGMPNLTKLKTILGFDVYKEDKGASITMTRQQKDGQDVPTTIHFATSAGDFVNDYRLVKSYHR